MDGIGHELGTVVGAHVTGRAVKPHQLFELLTHVSGPDAAVRADRQAAASKLVDDSEDLQPAPIVGLVADEVDGPHVVGVLGHPAHAGIVAVTEPPFLSLLLANLKSMFAAETLYALGVDGPSLPAEDLRSAAVPESRELQRQFRDFLNQGLVLVRLFALISLCRARLRERTARPPFRYTELPLHLLYGPPLARRAYQFPSATSLSMALSKARSATSRLSRPFSFSRAFSRFNSATVIVPY